MSARELIGRYIDVAVQGTTYHTFYDEAGQGIPLVLLHTAGADARQYHHIMVAPELDGYRTIAFDLPWHGRTLPPDGWWRAPYRLTREFYRAFVLAFIDALQLERPVLMGCSMGGAMALHLAMSAPRRFRAVIGLESTLYAPGRANPYLDHPHCNTSEVVATYTFGLNAPQSPERYTRENWWMYAQSGPGVYAGDVYFYSHDWDGREDPVPSPEERCPLYLLTGEYDYSCLPEMTLEAARRLEYARVTIMRGIGHFPMIENPPLFLQYLAPVLREIRAASGETGTG